MVEKRATPARTRRISRGEILEEGFAGKDSSSVGWLESVVLGLAEVRERSVESASAIVKPWLLVLDKSLLRILHVWLCHCS